MMEFDLCILSQFGIEEMLRWALRKAETREHLRVKVSPDFLDKSQTDYKHVVIGSISNSRFTIQMSIDHLHPDLGGYFDIWCYPNYQSFPLS